jgi:hypothetical protein
VFRVQQGCCLYVTWIIDRKRSPFATLKIFNGEEGKGAQNLGIRASQVKSVRIIISLIYFGFPFVLKVLRLIDHRLCNRSAQGSPDCLIGTHSSKDDRRVTSDDSSIHQLCRERSCVIHFPLL